jgi:hypothetical protein
MTPMTDQFASGVPTGRRDASRAVTVAAMVGVVAAVVLAWRAQRDIETADRQLPR